MAGLSWLGELFVASFFPQFFEQRFPRQRVDDVRLGEPAFARDARAEAEETGVLIAMRVAIDHTLYAFALRVRPEPPVQVEAIRVRVQFNPRPGFSAGVDDGLLVDLVRLAFEQEAAGQMAEHVNMSILHCADNAPGHLRFVLAEALMNAGFNDV